MIAHPGKKYKNKIYQFKEPDPGVCFMKCSVCGSLLNPLITDLPFKVSDQTIVILKGLPVLQCENCGEYIIDDSVMNRVEGILQKLDVAAELEIIRYAA
jgi:YgiT-type zinc finger domain-containing protein